VHQRITTWLLKQECARVPVDTRLDPRQWRNPSTPGQLDSVLCRLDAVLTTRLHGLVLALRQGVPVLAVDPLDGGSKVEAQAAAWGWPALVTADEVLKDADCLRPWWAWCLSAQGRMLAAERMTAALHDGEQLVSDLRGILHTSRSLKTGAP
jgi:exopolysaccharide biosynthesis predicted pyruvyltransferase EpsI